MLVFQKSGWCLCAWAAGTRSTTSTSCGSPRTSSGMPPVSNVPSAVNTWTSPARASSGTERLTVNGTTSGRTAGTGRDDPLHIKSRSCSCTEIGMIILMILSFILHYQNENIRTDLSHAEPCFQWVNTILNITTNHLYCYNNLLTMHNQKKCLYCISFSVHTRYI